MGVKKKNRTVIAQIRDMIEETGGFDYARNKLDEFSCHALNAISIYPDSPIKQSLSDLVAFNASRVK